MSVHLRQAAPDKIDRYWPKLEPLIERACAYSRGLVSPASVREKAKRGDFQVWVAYTAEDVKAVAVTCIARFPPGKQVGEVLLCAGTDRRSWLFFDDAIADWARANGCASLRVIGRKGWKRSLSPSWQEVATVFEREIGASAESAPEKEAA